ncbi:MAG TPA: ribosome recycling factor [Candidatus Saccharibacteria bacterium]|nr:ribosome recycling factor [Candidatus Saccharibacteria bacterium]
MTVEDAKTKFNQTVAHFQDELKKLRTGRASAAMLDGVMVEAYGTQMPLNQVGTVSAPEPQLLQISPFDPNNIQAITSAIRDNQSLGLNPMDDGHVVRLPIPPLTEERRRDITKQVSAKLEDCMISMRNTRHEAMDEVNRAKKDKEIGEDEAKRRSTQVDEAMNKAKSDAEAAAKAKETEIMTI